MFARLIGISLLLTLGSIPSAQAVTFYIESHTGTTQFRRSDNFFGTTVTNPTSLGFSFAMAFMASLTDGRDAMELQLGVMPRLSSASDEVANYSLLALSPVIRLQISRIYFSGGATPWVYGRVGPSAGVDSFTPAPSSLAYFAEVGFLWPLVPDFSLGAATRASWVSGGQGLSPNPLVDWTFLMRFYVGSIGGSTAAGSSRSSSEFKGWRYPFGYFR